MEKMAKLLSTLRDAFTKFLRKNIQGKESNMIGPGVNEDTIMQICADILNNGKLEELEVHHQLDVLEIISDAIKRYHAIELDTYLNELEKYFNADKKLSNL